MAFHHDGPVSAYKLVESSTNIRTANHLEYVSEEAEQSSLIFESKGSTKLSNQSKS
jgi:hypothetical protein